MKLLKQLSLAALLIYICVQAVFIFPRYLNKEKAASNPEPEGEKKSEQILQGVHLVESQKGSRDWELLADKAVTNNKTANWELQNVVVQFYNKETKEFIVKGNAGEIDTKTKNITINGDVSITSYNGYVFTTDNMFYNSEKRTIETESAIKVLGPKDGQGDGFLMTGTGLKAEVDTSKMTIPQGVKGQKKMNDGKAVEVTAGAAVMNGRQKEVIFQNGSRVLYAGMTITSPQATFKYNGNFLEEVFFEGGVSAFQDDRRATSQQLLVRLREQRLVFMGNPILTEKEDELRGEQITLYDGGRKVKVEKVKKEGDKK